MTQAASDASVIISTHSAERWDDLVEAVAAVQQQAPPPREVIVAVDHNPTLLEQVRACLPEVIAVENQEVRGASGTRNSGFAAATGREIIFLDDDVVVEPGWLAHVTHWCNEFRVLGAGAKTIPLWEGNQPSWLPDEFNWIVGCAYRGMPETVAPMRNLFTGNLCVRREVFESIGGFQRGFGKIGTQAEPEDTEFCIRALQRWPGWIWMYDPRTVVHHKVPANRSSWKYFVQRCYTEGLGKAAMVSLVGAGSGLSSERTYTFRVLPRGILRGIGDAFLRGQWAGLVRASVIIIGFTVTMLGYGIGMVTRRLAKRPKLKTNRVRNQEESTA